jgi:uncharacterized membrane protein YeaQ/YmgE (transglycosylase-associated protein family)
MTIDERKTGVEGGRPSGGEFARRVVILIFGIIQVLIALRFVLLLLNAREANTIVKGILDLSQIFVAPFDGILRTDALHASGSTLDITAIVAFVGWTILEMIVIWAVNIFRREPSWATAAIASGRVLPGQCSDSRVSLRGREGRRATMGIISWIVLGAIAGFLANLVVGGGEGVIGTIILGIIGAVVGGYLAQAIFHKGDVTGVNIESIVIAVVGAIIVLFVWRAVTRSRASGSSWSKAAADALSGRCEGPRYASSVPAWRTNGRTDLGQEIEMNNRSGGIGIVGVIVIVVVILILVGVIKL